MKNNKNIQRMAEQKKEKSPDHLDRKQKKKSPKWLKALEAQSWQAELLISGLVVAGLVQAPKLLMSWLEVYLYESTEMGFMFLNFASMILMVGIQCLILFFGFHFLMRGIWVALLGLNSVFPDGIDVSSTVGNGPKYWAKAKEKYPNLSGYNLELDKQCSLIFSLATVTIIMLTSFSILILFVYKIFQLIVSIFPGFADYVIHFAGGLYVLFLLAALGGQHLMKRYPNNKRIEKFAMAFGSVSENVFSLYFFKKPIAYITNIITSNSKSKYGFIIVTVASFFLGMFGANQTDESPVYRYFSADRYYAFNNRPHMLQTFNYDNLRTEGQLIFTPVIPSDQISGERLKVFIPTVPREKETMNLVDFSLNERRKLGFVGRDSVYAQELKNYADFNKVFVNNKAYPDLDFQYYKHPNAGERGVLTYIPTVDFKQGKNVLEIRKEYFSKEGVQKVVAIPFYFE